MLRHVLLIIFDPPFHVQFAGYDVMYLFIILFSLLGFYLIFIYLFNNVIIIHVDTYWFESSLKA